MGKMGNGRTQLLGLFFRVELEETKGMVAIEPISRLSVNQ